jgi:hypothetical protein
LQKEQELAAQYGIILGEKKDEQAQNEND